MTSVLKFHPAAPKSIFNGFLDEFMNRNLVDFVGADLGYQQPAVNVTESESGFNLQLAAPGYEKKDFNLNLENDHLTISVNRENRQEAQTERFVRREFRYESFKRSFKLPQTVNREAVSAVYENGILSVSLPKKEEAKPVVKTVEVV